MEISWRKITKILETVIAAVLLCAICGRDATAAQKEENLKTIRVGYLIYDGFQ